jgi:hypothetical protein
VLKNEAHFQNKLSSKIKHLLLNQKKEWNAMIVRFQKEHSAIMKKRQCEEEVINKLYKNSKGKILQVYNIKKSALASNKSRKLRPLSHTIDNIQ